MEEKEMKEKEKEGVEGKGEEKEKSPLLPPKRRSWRRAPQNNVGRRSNEDHHENQSSLNADSG